WTFAEFNRKNGVGPLAEYQRHFGGLQPVGIKVAGRVADKPADGCVLQFLEQLLEQAVVRPRRTRVGQAPQEIRRIALDAELTRARAYADPVEFQPGQMQKGRIT